MAVSSTNEAIDEADPADTPTNIERSTVTKVVTKSRLGGARTGVAVALALVAYAVGVRKLTAEARSGLPVD